MLSLLAYVPANRIGLLPSFLLVYGLGVVGLGTALVLALVRLVTHARRARLAREAAARASGATRSELREGYAVLTGTVEQDEPGEPAITVRIDQLGREWSTKNGWQHAWTEIARQVDARPFTLALESGERVRVMPNQRVFLVDSLDDKQRTDALHRVRTARLTQGERVTITGELRYERDPHGGVGAGYRDAGRALVLRPPRGERMLISTQPLDARHAHWIRFYAITGALLAASFALLHGVVYLPFHRLNASGVVVSATVVRTGTYTTRSKNTTTTHYTVEARDPDGHTLNDDISAGAYRALSVGDRIPFLVVPDHPEVHQVGLEPTISLGWAMMLLVGMGVGGGIFYVARRDATPWYEQKRVVERGSGHL